MMNQREKMDQLTDEEYELLERVAKVLGKDIETIYYKWSKNDTIKELVNSLEKAW